MTQRILLTGAAGHIGHMLRARLPRRDRILRLLDVVDIDDAEPGTEVIRGDLADDRVIDAACRDVDAILHFGGRAKEAPWEEIQRVNVDGTRGLLDAARAHGIRRVVIASSYHAVGFRGWRDGGPELAAGSPARPDSYYGWSKAAMESLGSLYADRFAMTVICLRIGSCGPRPGGESSLSTWISPDDMARLVEASLSTTERGFHTVWGVSANTRRWWSLAEGERIGYRPLDNAEDVAETIRPDPGLADRPLGGVFSIQPLGQPFT